MTKEEAKEIISYHKHLVDNDKSGLLDKELEYQAIDMAIKALEQKPCEDYISREKAKQFLYERLDIINDDELYDIFSRIIDDMYNELPFVEREPKQEPILNKIRAEILACLKALDGVEKFNIYFPNEITGRRLTYQQCLGFIDKYKIESEI